MNILIAEDELREQKALFLLLNKYYAQYINKIDCVNDGLTALEKIKSQHYDLVFMDIQMPKMLGIDAIKEIRKFNESIKIIIVTAYTEFDYAKKAIQNNVFEYLIKPYSVKTLKSVMNNLIERFEIEADSKNRVDELQSLLGNLFLEKLILEIKFENGELEQYKKKLLLESNRYMVVFVKNDEKLTIDYILNQLFDSNNIELRYYFYNISNYTALLFFNTNFYLLHKLQNTILNKKENWFVSRIESDFSIIEELVKTTKTKLPEISNEGESFFQLVKDAIIYNDKNNLNILVSKSVSKFVLVNGVNEKLFSYLYNQYLKTIENLYGIGKFPAEKIASQLKINELYFSNKDLKNIINNSVEAYLKLYDKYNVDIKSSKQLLVEKTIEVITNNFHKNISLEYIANKCNVSESYLSRVFNPEVGISVMDFLLHYRIDMAKELLLKEYNINIIAEKVGFSSPHYFTKCFKKIVGQSPSEYKKCLKKTNSLVE